MARDGRGAYVIWEMSVYISLYIAMLLPWAYRDYVTFGHFTFSTRGFGNALFFGSDPKVFANSDIYQATSSRRRTDRALFHAGPAIATRRRRGSDLIMGKTVERRSEAECRDP
jgi:hypothetical protein